MLFNKIVTNVKFNECISEVTCEYLLYISSVSRPVTCDAE